MGSAVRKPRLLHKLLAGVAFGALSIGLAAAQAVPQATPAHELQVLRIKPSEADPGVKDFDDANLIVVDRLAAARPPLVVFLPGTGGRPGNVQGLLEVVAGQGYRVIGLQYDDEPSVVQLCPRQPDAECSERFRRERIFGGEGAEAPVHNPAAETIVRRLVMLLRSLDRQDPQSHWADYLAGDEPEWSRIVVSGLSQGAGMAAYIAKQRPVARVVLFSSPWDFQGPERTLAPWLGQASRTPPERWYAEFHQTREHRSLDRAGVSRAADTGRPRPRLRSRPAGPGQWPEPVSRQHGEAGGVCRAVALAVRRAVKKPAHSGGLVYSTDAGRMCPACRKPLASCSCAAAKAIATPAGDGIARIRRETGGRGGKTVTVVSGLPLDEAALAALAKRLKAACGTGGTVRQGLLELQGDHRDQVVALLAREGFRSKLAGG